MSPALAGGFLTTAPPGKPSKTALRYGNQNRETHPSAWLKVVRNLGLGLTLMPGSEKNVWSSNTRVKFQASYLVWDL